MRSNLIHKSAHHLESQLGWLCFTATKKLLHYAVRIVCIEYLKGVVVTILHYTMEIVKPEIVNC